ncbi:MAG: hypothetical protein SYR96_19130 [Actinomycetota bacterium]|nr:hypothetical protein [Actinomycetota bacterium]
MNGTQMTRAICAPAAGPLVLAGCADDAATDNVPLRDYTGDGAERTGGAVDIDPFFDAGTYTCGDDSLTVTPDDDGDLPVVLERT